MIKKIAENKDDLVTDVIHYFQSQLDGILSSSTEIVKGIIVIIENELWQVRTINGQSKEYEYFADFVMDASPFGMDIEFSVIEKLCKGNRKAESLLAKNKKYTETEYVKQKRKRRPKKTQKEYYLIRLQKKNPELFEQYLNGEISFGEALYLAGIDAPAYQRVSISKYNPDSALNSILKKCSKEFIEELLLKLSSSDSQN